MAKVIRYTLAAMFGALAAWIIMEPTPLMPESSVPGVEPAPISFAGICAIGLIAGLFIGLGLGIAGLLSGGSPREAARGVMVSALFGAAGGLLGLVFGNAVYGAIAPPLPSGDVPANSQLADAAPGLFSFILRLFGRGFGWALIGGFCGMSQGVATSSTRKMINGAVGGLIGGGIGGSIFEILAWLNLGHVANFSAWMVRMIAFACTGAAIGLFISFIDEMAKQAWLIRLVGRNEGNEISIFKPETIIGRDEYADVPVFTDPDVSPRHARIIAIERRHYLEDLGSTFGTILNGSKVDKREVLHDGDSIEVGKTKFLFRDKLTARAGARPYTPSVQIPTSEHICPFCGAPKKPDGSCDCTVNPQAPAQNNAQQVPQQNMTQQTAAPDDPFRTVATTPMASQPTAAIPAANGNQGAKLIAMAGPYNGRTFILQDETQIGREASKDIGLPMDNTVSRNHARIAHEVTKYVIYDLGSTNGTYVNGTRITSKDLAVGDVVQIGSSKFRFEE